MKTATTIFHDRTDAAHRLAQEFAGRGFRSPLVLGIPRGGVVTGSALARDLHAELDVVLARKLRDPEHPEFALGAVSEDGEIMLNPTVTAGDEQMAASLLSHLEQERQHQMAEIRRRKEMYRAVGPAAPVAGRSVIVTDDGLATGSTMLAALQSVRGRQPFELIAAVPVAAPGRCETLADYCDEVVCIRVPRNFYAVGQFYDNFEEVDDQEVVELLEASNRRT
jgi:putative phosphoribosyl transferase